MIEIDGLLAYEHETTLDRTATVINPEVNKILTIFENLITGETGGVIDVDLFDSDFSEIPMWSGEHPDALIMGKRTTLGLGNKDDKIHYDPNFDLWLTELIGFLEEHPNVLAHVHLMKFEEEDKGMLADASAELHWLINDGLMWSVPDVDYLESQVAAFYKSVQA